MLRQHGQCRKWKCQWNFNVLELWRDKIWLGIYVAANWQSKN